MTDIQVSFSRLSRVIPLFLKRSRCALLICIKPMSSLPFLFRLSACGFMEDSVCAIAFNRSGSIPYLSPASEKQSAYATADICISIARTTVDLGTILQGVISDMHLFASYFFLLYRSVAITNKLVHRDRNFSAEDDIKNSTNKKFLDTNIMLSTKLYLLAA